MKKTTAINPVERSTAGLKTVLFDAIDGVRSSEITYKDAITIAMLATAIVRIIKLEKGGDTATNA